MSDDCCRIEKLQNGYEVEIQDPKIVANNALPYDKRPKSGDGGYKSPWVSYVFKDVTEVLAFLKTALPKAVSGNSFDSCFDTCASAPEDD
jgi:hypothetical protein